MQWTLGPGQLGNNSNTVAHHTLSNNNLDIQFETEIKQTTASQIMQDLRGQELDYFTVKRLAGSSGAQTFCEFIYQN